MRNISAVAVVLIACCTSWVQGEIRTFAMEGTVSYKNDSLGLLDWVHPGDRMVYTFSFASDAPDTDPLPTVARYNGMSALVTIGGNPIDLAPPRILIGHPSDLFLLENTFVFGSYTGYAGLTLSDQGPISDALQDTLLPTVPYDLTPWMTKYFNLHVFVPQPGYPPNVVLSLAGDIDAFYVVPEPGTIMLLWPLACLRRRCLRMRTSQETRD